MTDLLDLIGFPLEEALAMCRDTGLEVEIVITRPVKAQIGENPRVVRLSQVSKNKGVLTVVMEYNGRGGG